VSLIPVEFDQLPFNFNLYMYDISSFYFLLQITNIN
jgi:hypothetical protein